MFNITSLAAILSAVFSATAYSQDAFTNKETHDVIFEFCDKEKSECFNYTAVEKDGLFSTGNSSNLSKMSSYGVCKFFDYDDCKSGEWSRLQVVSAFKNDDTHPYFKMSYSAKLKNNSPEPFEVRQVSLYVISEDGSVVIADDELVSMKIKVQ